MLIACVAALLLTACSGSGATESHLAQERDATKGAVLPGLQATRTVKEYFPPTPTPGPTMTPRATIASLRLATQVSGDGQAIDSIERASAGQSIYAVAELSHLRTGEKIAAIWYNSTGEQLGEVDQTVNADSDSAWVALPWTVASGAYGNCWVEIWVGDTRMNSIVFNVG